MIRFDELMTELDEDLSPTTKAVLARVIGQYVVRGEQLLDAATDLEGFSEGSKSMQSGEFARLLGRGLRSMGEEGDLEGDIPPDGFDASFEE